MFATTTPTERKGHTIITTVINSVKLDIDTLQRSVIGRLPLALIRKKPKKPLEKGCSSIAVTEKLGTAKENPESGKYFFLNPNRILIYDSMHISSGIFMSFGFMER